MHHLSSIVFVGNDFAAKMFDERKLFDAEPDRERQVRVGPFAQFSYSSGSYQFACTPERIDLKYIGPSILPEEVIVATERVILALDNARGAISISGFGMNCDTVFEKQLIPTDGRSFCLGLVNRSNAQRLFDTSFTAEERFRFTLNSVLFSVRIEPHWRSDGDNLFVSVNGHQSVSPNDTWDSKMTKVDTFRKMVSELHYKISTLEGVG